jgi:hyperosmotically inducible periplasmic protein
MRTPQVIASVMLVAAAAVACNRSESDANAQRTAGQVKTAAARAGHQLADSWLTTKIQAQYFADDDIKARHINVSTRDGIVTLTGFVEGPPQRDLAVQIARTTDGVRQVSDRLTVRGPARESGATATTGETPPAVPGNEASIASAANAPSPPSPPDDALVTARVQSKFFVDDRVKGRRIDVDTRNGVVTLSGAVADEEERAQALLLARTAEGVVRVEDHLTVATAEPAPVPDPARPAIDDATLTTTIQAKYFVDTTVKGSAIDVSTRDGVVLLQGTVPSDAVRKQALAIAQNTEGVVQVVDRVHVAPAPTRR